MKLRNLFAVTLAATTLFSCTKEIIIEVPGGGGGNQDTGYANVSFSLTSGKPETKAAQDHSSATPTTEENKIYNYAVLIFNSQRMLEEVITESPYTSTGQTPADYTDGLLFHDGADEAVYTITAGLKYFFAIANAPKDLVDELLELYESHDLSLNDLSWDLEVKNLLDIASNNVDPGQRNRGYLMTTNGQLPYEVLAAVDDLTDPASVVAINLYVGKAMAKVSVASELTDNTLTNITYKVGNNPDKMNIIPDVLSNGVYLTPYYTKYSEGTIDQSKYYDSPKGYQTVSVENALTWDYAMENTNKKPKEGNSTLVYIKGVYTPATVYQWNDPNWEPVAGTPGTFWRIRETVAGKIGYREEIYKNDPTGRVVLNSNEEIVEYLNGVSYYGLWLKDSASSNAAPYAVKRNSYYMVDIVSVSGPGEPDENGVIDPEEPLDGEANISARIYIDPWTPINQQGEL